MMRIYARVSTTEQASDGRTSMADQERKARGIAMMRGDTEIEVYADPGVSGGVPLQRRPAGKRLLDEARKGDVIVASRLDRLFRSASDALSTVEVLQKRGISVVLADIGPDPVTENGTAKLSFSMLAAFAEFDRYRIVERTNDGRRGKKARGGHAGGSAPFGFAISGVGPDAILVPNEREQVVLNEMLRLHRAGTHPKEIVRSLTAANMRDRVGSPFVTWQIRRITARHDAQRQAMS